MNTHDIGWRAPADWQASVCVEEIRPGYIHSSPSDGMGPSTSGRTWLRQSRFLGLMRVPGFGETGPDTGRPTVLSRQPAPAWWPPCTERGNQLIAYHAAPAAVTGAHPFKWIKKIQSEFISGINCVKDLRGESLHGLPSLGLTDPPAAAGNKEYVIKFLGPRISCADGDGINDWIYDTHLHVLMNY